MASREVCGWASRACTLELNRQSLMRVNSLTHSRYYMGDHEIPVVQSGIHLGVMRDSSGRPSAQINNNIKKARGAAYSLMGAGLHGKNGLPQDCCIHLYQIHILPILTYGLGIFSLDENEIKPLEQFQKTILKQILSLSDNTTGEMLKMSW